MIHFTSADYIILLFFFLLLIATGYFASRRGRGDDDSYFLAGKKIGIVLFVVTNVSTWYGGILGIGEFTYQYGLVTWFTQGLPYYFFAILFAFFMVKKVYAGDNITIPQKIEAVYGSTAGKISSVFVFILSSPAPYLLMIAQILNLFFGLPLIWGLIISALLSIFYLIRGGLHADIYVDAFLFIIMFSGFGMLLWSVYSSAGSGVLTANLPEQHLSLTGGLSPLYLGVWWMIAVWTFVDPGFHQRVKAARSAQTAKWGVIISVFLWLVFDFLTNVTGLYTAALLPGLSDPKNSFPLLADTYLSSGLKGFFFAALFSTILSTSNSFLFISGTTLGIDFVKRGDKKKEAMYGMIFSAILAVVLALMIPSVIGMWYLIGSVCVPGLLLATLGSYFPNLRLSKEEILLGFILGSISAVFWYILREFGFVPEEAMSIEPMIAGLVVIILLVLRERFIRFLRK
ncbi:MAG: proline permease [Ignavibacteriales bacterium]